VNPETQWGNSQPIYRQLRDRVVAMILEGVLKEGDPLPSVRTVAAEFRINPLTVLKGYQQLVDEQLVESAGDHRSPGPESRAAAAQPGPSGREQGREQG
jgi:DNA-binding transcriptional regulator YhcF (GntR family)